MKKITVGLFIFLLTLQGARGTDLAWLEQYVRQRLEPQTTNEALGTCGFSAQLELRRHWRELPPELQSAALNLLQEPKRQTSTVSPSGHFVLHYDTTGYNAVPLADVSGNGVPDYVDSAAVYLDHAWQVEIDSLGFAPPPAANGNPVTTYPIYFTNFGYYGMTSFDPNEDIAALPGNNYTSYIELNNDFYSRHFYTTGLAALKVTAAHEFNHAIQLGYNFRIEGNSYPDIFFMEMTSTWLEDYVYDEVNDYVQYLSAYLPTIDGRAFNAWDGNSEYANSLYLHMLAERYNPQIVPEVWRQINREPALNALNTVLKKHGSNFADSHNRYAVWVYFTGTRAVPGKYFPEAADYPLISIFYTKNKLNESLPQLSMRHVESYVQTGYTWRAKVSSNSSAGRLTHITALPQVPAPVAFNNWQLFYQNADQPIVVVETNPLTKSIDQLSYTVELSPVTPGPNLVKTSSTRNKVVFYNVPSQAKIQIFSVNGQLVTRLQNQSGEVQHLSWDLTDRLGQKVATGIYVYYIRMNQRDIVGKFAVVR